MNLRKFKFEIATAKNANNDKIWNEVRKLFFKKFFLQVSMTAVSADQYDATESTGPNIFASLRSFEKNNS